MLKIVFSFLTGACLLAFAAAPPSIGVVKSTGEFRVNGSPVPGNTTLFDGDVIETSATRTVVQLGTAQITLLPESRAHIFHERTTLEKGSGILGGARNHTIEAGTLRIVPAKNSVVQVEIVPATRVSVAAREGGAEVRNASGVLIASLDAGMALEFEPQAGAASAVQMTGTLESRNGRYFLNDSITHVTFELQGTDLEKFVGREVEVTGSSIPNAAASAALQAVQVVTIKPVTRKKPGAAGLPSAAKVAMVGGVAVAGAVVGLGAAGTFSGSSTVSRQ